MTRVVFDSRAVTDFLQHLQVIAGALLKALGFRRRELFAFILAESFGLDYTEPREAAAAL